MQGRVLKTQKTHQQPKGDKVGRVRVEQNSLFLSGFFENQRERAKNKQNSQPF